MYDAVLVDVGLEHCRVSLMQRNGGGRPRFAHNHEFPVAEFDGLSDMLEHYRATIGMERLPRVAGVAFAGPVRGHRASYSNGLWTFSEQQLKSCFGFDQFVPVNDVAALAASLPWLGAKDLSPVGEVPNDVTRNIGDGRYAVIFAGLGLGVAALTHSAKGYDVIDTEAGHASFAPATPFDAKVLDRLVRTFGRVSYERLLSTPGLVNIYRAVCEIDGQQPAAMTPLEVLLYGRTDADPACRRALDVFYSILGSFAGDVALNLCTEGGVYLVSDVIAETDDALHRSDFRKRFCDKGRFAEFVSAIPTFAVGNRSARLIGLSRLVSDAITARDLGESDAAGTTRAFGDAMDVLDQTVVVVSAKLTIVSVTGRTWGDAAMADGGLAAGADLGTSLAALETAGVLGLDPSFGGVGNVIGRMQRGESFSVDRRLFGGRIAELRVSPRDGGGYVIVSRDVTELRKRTRDLEDLARNLRAASSQAEAASRAKSQFLANMSHEIRTPLNGVLGMAEILSKTQLNDDQRQMIDTVIASGTHLLSVINDILDFSKIEAGKMRLSSQPFDLRNALEDAMAALAPPAEAKRLELALRLEPGLRAAVIGDEVRIRQILNNVVGNAIKFTDTGHVLVEVESAPCDGRLAVSITVSDTGCGIPKDKLGHVFEVFEQVDGSASRRHDGSGLGLAITRRLLDLMDGTISVESEIGAGTTFRITFLVEPATAELPAEPDAGFDVSGREILIVDDKAVNCRILEEQARSWGMRPVSTPDAAGALEMLRTKGSDRFAMAILDYQMPNVNGIELAKAIKRHPRWSRLPLMLLTSVGHLGDLDREEAALFAGVLVKPARTGQLAAKVRAIVQHAETQRTAPAPQAVTAEPEPAPAPAPGGDEPAVPSARLKVLVAEDNPINRKVIDAMLANDGYDIQFAFDGEAAVTAYRAALPDIVLMDVSMPKMDGYGATAEIRKIEAALGRRAAVIGLTAHAMPEDRQACLDAGMDEYLAKPLRQEALRDIVARVAAAR